MALSALLVVLAIVGGHSESVSVNPIRRVVTMLQMMQKKVEAEGEKEAKLFEKFMCYCKSGGGELEGSIGDAERKIPQLESDLEAAGAEKEQLESDIVAHKKDRDAAKAAMKEAKGVREKEAADFAAVKADSDANIEAMAKAISAISKGMAGGFLQTGAAGVLRKFVQSAAMDEGDRDTLTAFLAAGNGYAPQSGQITGILKQMMDTWNADLAAAIESEKKAKADYEALVASKSKLVAVLQKTLEEKTVRLGEVGVELTNIAEDLDDTKNALAADQKFLKDLAANCKKKAAEWEVRKKTRADEIVALADTIKILNDDDALELFKKTLPTPASAFLQVQVTSKEVVHRARHILSSARQAGIHDRRLDLIALALHGRKVDFSKVIKMIDDMVALLGKEQADDDAKKAYCEKEFDEAEDEQKALARQSSLLAKAIEKNKADISTLTEEIAALTTSIKDLDTSVAEATEQRKQEHTAYEDDLASNTATKEILGIAKNRLNKFYNPKLYKPAPKRELSEEERITVNMGGELAATSPPGGIAGTGVTASFVQISMHSDDEGAPPPPPETFDAYQKKGQESSGVIQMIDLLAADIAKEMQENEVDETHAQEEYEQFVADSATKRADDSKLLAEKEGVKADTSAALQKNEVDSKDTLRAEMANDKYISDLHAECDWLIQNFETRVKARAGEVESLKNAKAVLSGSDFSLLQTRNTHLRGKHA